MTKKILIIGGIGSGKSALMLQSTKEGLKIEDFENIPTMKITAPPIMEHPTLLGAERSGKEKRRDRRKQERKSK